MSWKKEEKDACAFLKNLQLKDIIFKNFGQHDSSTPDIKVFKKDKFFFYIEVKMIKAQSSQFVIEKLQNEFKISDKNKTQSNHYKIKILEYLNTHFNEYENINSTGIEIRCNKNLGYGHIISDFKSKNIKYIMSKPRNQNFKIIHINNFKSFYDIKCILRTKKSGSSPVSKKCEDEVSNYLIKNFNAISINYTDKKFLFKSSIPNLLGKYFRVNEEQYFIAKEKFNDFFRVNKTSKTNNPNVIFEIQLINNNINDNMKLFLKDLSI